MNYISTRGQAPALDFEQVLLTGLAADGGLYVPQHLPVFSREEPFMCTAWLPICISPGPVMASRALITRLSSAI